MTVLIDANVLITAKNTYFSFAVCPGFWDWIQDGFQSGRFLLLDSVFTEISAGNDDLSTWIQNQPITSFDQSAATAIPTVANYVAGLGYQQSALNTFFQATSADQFLIAYGFAHNLGVISNEVADMRNRRRVTIPDVCDGLGTECTPFIPWLREESPRFVWER